MRSPATIGDERPGGAGTFQRTFLSGPNSTGGFWSSATPDPLGPRNWGQASGRSAATAAAARIRTASDENIRIMSTPSLVTGRLYTSEGRTSARWVVAHASAPGERNVFTLRSTASLPPGPCRLHPLLCRLLGVE